MSKPVLHPVFIDRSFDGQGRAARPQDAVEGIVAHMLLIDEASEHVVRTALTMFAVQCMAYAAGREDASAVINYPRTPEERRASARLELTMSLLAMAQTADERISKEDDEIERHYRASESRARLTEDAA